MWLPWLVAIPVALGTWAILHVGGESSEPPSPTPATSEALQQLISQKSPANAPPSIAALSQDEPSDEGSFDDSSEIDDWDSMNGSQDDSSSPDDDSSQEKNEELDDSASEGRMGEGVEENRDLADGFWVQIASLERKEKADRLAAELRARGHNVQTHAYGGPRAGWWHVVRLGPFSTRIEAEAAKIAFVQTERTPAVVMPRARGPYHIQIASLRSEANAKSLASKLSRRGHHAIVRTVNTGSNGTWYTVRIGPFESQKDAMGYQNLLYQHDKLEGEIVPRNNL